MMAADTILCWRNVTRHKVNARMRSLLGYNLPYPQAGEPVLCLKNSHQHAHDSPHFHTTPKVSANTGISASISANRSISGNSRGPGILGIRS